MGPNPIDDAIAVIRKQFKCLGCLVQTESMGDHKIRLDPARPNQFDYRVDTFILAPNIYKGKSVVAFIVHSPAESNPDGVFSRSLWRKDAYVPEDNGSIGVGFCEMADPGVSGS
jgi:hypothetical protein